MSDLARLSEAAIMLADARTLPDIRKVLNIADRLKDYAKAARLSIDAQNSAAAIAIEAEAKAGELLARMAETGERRTPRTANPSGAPLIDVPDEGPSLPVTLADLGVTPNESSAWQAVASVPPEARAAYVASATEREVEVTRTGLLKAAGVKPVKAPKATRPVDPIDTMTDRHRELFPQVAAAHLSAEVATAVAEVRTFRLDPAKWADRIGEMRPEDIENVRQKVAHVHRWCDAWDALLAPRPLTVVGGSRP